jgi:DNA-binding transcriptional MocR family regulator
VLVAIKSGRRHAREVKDEVSSELSVSRRTVERAAGALERDGLLKRDKTGFPAVATWELIPVATIPDTSGVATEENPTNAWDSGSSSASSDNAGCRGATENSVATEGGRARLNRQASEAEGCARAWDELTRKSGVGHGGEP